jgi:hypothetical protein
MGETNNDVWQKDAAAIARSFLMMFNGALLYGCAHPNTAKNAASFCELLNRCFNGREIITIIATNGTFMIEDWPLDGSFNYGKLFAHFEKLGLTSISFEPGVDADSIVKLVGLAGDVHNIDTCRVGIEEAKASGFIPHIRINYILFGKIRADEVVVNKGSVGTPTNALAGTGASNISTGRLSQTAAAQIEQVLTLSSLLETPKEISAALAKTDTSRFSMDELHDAFGGIKGEIDESDSLSAEELLLSLHNLKQDLYEAIEVQRATGKMMRSAAVINNELNDLTCRAIVRLVRDEYKSGKTPLNRLAHMIRRMLPNSAELMHILPNLKAMLLDEGMSLSDYLELVRILGLSLESESLSDSLKEAADSVGATVHDLVNAIKSSPEDAAKLILLASEIKQGTGEDASRLSGMLTNYIEEISSKMAVDKCGGSNSKDSKALKQVLAQLESQMFGQLTSKGVPDAVLLDVKQRLASRFETIFSSANEEFLANIKTNPQTQTSATSNNVKINMPPEALNAGNLLFLMNKELKRHIRYKTPLASVTVSMEKIIQNNHPRPLTPEDAATLLPQLFKLVHPLLRDVDMTGALETANHELFIILPMTGEEGTEIVRERIVKTISESTFELVGIDGTKETVNVTPKVSVTMPNEDTKSLKSYMALVHHNHKKEKK